MHFGSRPYAPLFQKLKQPAIAFIDTAHVKVLPGRSLRKQQQPATPAARGTLQFGQIAMRTGDPSSELRQQPSLKVRRNRVFQPFGLIVHLIPLHTKNLGKHALDQMVTNRQFAGNLSSDSG